MNKNVGKLVLAGLAIGLIAVTGISSLAEQPAGSPLNEAAAQDKLESLHQLELKAQKLAESIRSQPKGQGDSLRAELNQTLEAALTLKFEVENQQVRSLEELIAQLKSRIALRSSAKQKIIERRAAELVDGDTTRWSGDEPSSTERSTPRPSSGLPRQSDSQRVVVKTLRILDAASEARPKRPSDDVATRPEPVTPLAPTDNGNQLKQQLKDSVDETTGKSSTDTATVVDESQKEPDRPEQKRPNPAEQKLLDQIRTIEKYKVERLSKLPRDQKVIGQMEQTDLEKRLELSSLDECLTVLNHSTDFALLSKAMVISDQNLRSGSPSNEADQSRLCEALIHLQARIDSDAKMAHTKQQIQMNAPFLTSAQSAPCLIPSRISQFPPAVRCRAFSKILPAQDQAAQVVILGLISPLWNYLDCEDFPSLCEQIFALASNGPIASRIVPIEILCRTLPLTQRGPTEFHSAELQEKSKRLAVAVAPDRVISIVSNSLQHPDTNAVVSVAQVVLSSTRAHEQDAKLAAPELINQTVDALLSIISGKYQNQGVSAGVRHRALHAVTLVPSQSARVASALIDLLKNNHSSFDEAATANGFSRVDVFKRLATDLAQYSKEAIPLMEDELLLISAQKDVNAEKIKAIQNCIRKINPKKPAGIGETG